MPRMVNSKGMGAIAILIRAKVPGVRLGSICNHTHQTAARTIEITATAKEKPPATMHEIAILVGNFFCWSCRPFFVRILKINASPQPANPKMKPKQVKTKLVKTRVVTDKKGTD